MRTPPMPYYPQPAPRVWPRVRRQLLLAGIPFTAALLTGVLATPNGWLAVALGWALAGFLASRHDRVRTVTEWAAVATLAAIVVTATPHAPQAKTPLKAPVKVEASQTDYLEQVREGVVNLYQQIATGFPDPDKTPPKSDKGGRP